MHVFIWELLSYDLSGMTAVWGKCDSCWMLKLYSMVNASAKSVFDFTCSLHFARKFVYLVAYCKFSLFGGIEKNQEVSSQWCWNVKHVRLDPTHSYNSFFNQFVSLPFMFTIQCGEQVSLSCVVISHDMSSMVSMCGVAWNYLQESGTCTVVLLDFVVAEIY